MNIIAIRTNLYRFVISTFLITSFCQAGFAIDAQSMGRGGTFLFNSTLNNSLLNSPASLANSGFSLEDNINLSATDSLLSLIKQNPNPIAGSYDSEFSPFYGKELSADGSAGILFDYKGFTIAPFMYLTEGNVSLQNPVYPNANGEVLSSQGFGSGYGGTYKRIKYGLSYLSFKTADQYSSANILNYNHGVITQKSSYYSYILNSSLGYDLTKNATFLVNYQHNTVGYTYLDRVFMGGRYSFNRFNFYLELQDLQSDTFLNSSHFGASYQVFNFLELDTGLNQGFLSYGIGINTSVIKIFYSKSGANQYNYYREQYNESSLSVVFGINL